MTREPHIHTPAHDPVRHLPPIRDLGSPEYWRLVLPKKPDWWDRVFATPWEKADG